MALELNNILFISNQHAIVQKSWTLLRTLRWLCTEQTTLFVNTITTFTKIIKGNYRIMHKICLITQYTIHNTQCQYTSCLGCTITLSLTRLQTILHVIHTHLHWAIVRNVGWSENTLMIYHYVNSKKRLWLQDRDRTHLSLSCNHSLFFHTIHRI